MGKSTVGYVAESIVEQNSVEKFKCLDDRMRDLLPYTDYRVHKGDSFHISREIETTLSGRPNVSDDVLDHVYDALEDHIKQYVCARYDPLPFEDVINTKDPSTSPGYPMRNIWTNFGDMRDEIVVDDMVADLYAWENSILHGEPVVTPVIQVFGKRDRYSSSKLASGRYRTIQCTDLGVIMLMKRYFSEYIERLELSIPWIYLITNTPQYDLKIARLRRGANIGVDFTAYDRCQSAYLVRRTLRLLCDLAHVPSRIADFIVDTISRSICVTPDGNIYTPGGLNPSGHFLTSPVNTLNHMVMNLCFFLEEAQIPSSVILKGMGYGQEGAYVAAMTGDDGIDHFNDLTLLKIFRDKYAHYMQCSFAIGTKLDYRITKDGKEDVFWNMLPPYLSAVEVQVGSVGGDVYVLVPARPNRVLSSLQWCSPSDHNDPDYDNKRTEQLQGILTSFSAYFDDDVSGWLTRPKQVTALETTAAQFGLIVSGGTTQLLSDIGVAVQHCAVVEQRNFALTDNAMVKVELIEEKQQPKKGKRNRKKKTKKAKLEQLKLVTFTPNKPKPKPKAVKVTLPTKYNHPAARIMENEFARAVLQQMILPHESGLHRIRGSDSGCVLDTTLAKSFKVLTVDTTAVRNAAIARWPTFGNGDYVWNLAEGYDAFCFYDAYVLGVLPMVAAPGSDSRSK